MMYTDLNSLISGIAGFGAGVLVFVFALLFIIGVMWILKYIFESLALYKLMNNRNLDNAFLAWIPVVRHYTFGKIYDNINEKQGKQTNFSIILLILNCIKYLPFFLHISINGIDIIRTSSGLLGLAIMVLELICYNLIFKKYAPNNSGYFALTVIFSIIPIVPFIPGLCLLKASNNEPVSTN